MTAMTPERLEHLRWLCSAAVPGHCMAVEGRELLAEVDRLRAELASLLEGYPEDGVPGFRPLGPDEVTTPIEIDARRVKQEGDA